MHHRGIALATLLVTAAAIPGTAQTTSRGCFWPAPATRCSSWFITEAGVFKRFTDRQPGDEHSLFNWTLGWMHNANAATSWGGEVFGSAEGELRGGLALRTRRWVSPEVAVDFVSGIHLFGDASSQHVSAGSPMAMLRLSYVDMVALSVRMDILSLRCTSVDCDPVYIQHPNGTSRRLYLGAELGNRLGVLGDLVTGAVVGIVVAVCCRD